MYRVYIDLEVRKYSNTSKKNDPKGYKQQQAVFKNKTNIFIDKKEFKTPIPAFKYFEKLTMKVRKMGSYKKVSINEKTAVILKNNKVIGVSL